METWKERIENNKEEIKRTDARDIYKSAFYILSGKRKGR